MGCEYLLETNKCHVSDIMYFYGSFISLDYAKWLLIDDTYFFLTSRTFLSDMLGCG